MNKRPDRAEALKRAYEAAAHKDERVQIRHYHKPPVSP